MKARIFRHSTMKVRGIPVWVLYRPGMMAAFCFSWLEAIDLLRTWLEFEKDRPWRIA